jgi:PAS domain S-box-containing protein
MQSTAHPVRQVLAGVAMIGLGTVLAAIHGYHLVREVGVVGTVIGSVVPLVLSLILVGAGLAVVRARWEWSTTSKLVAWLAVGMLWNTAVGIGAVIYEIVGGATLTHPQFLVPIFATYGSVPGLVTGWYDAQRRRRTRDLRRHEEAMDAAADGMAILDGDADYVYVNEALVEMFGYEDPQALRGRGWSAFFPEESSHQLETAVVPGVRETGSWRGEAVTERANGTTFSVELTVSQLDGEWVVVIVRDISDRKDRTRAISAIDRLFRHNLHNDMSVVRGNAEIVRERASGEAAEIADQIIETSDDLIETVDKERRIVQLLVEDSPRQRLDLVPTVGALVEALDRRHPDVSFEADLPETATVVAVEQFDRALQELLENAVEHAEADGCEVAVAVAADTETVTVTVSDTGPGIPEMERAVLTDAHEEPLFHGSGMGLWFVYWTVRQSGGRVAFADNEPRGSVVTVELQRADTE